MEQASDLPQLLDVSRHDADAPAESGHLVRFLIHDRGWFVDRAVAFRQHRNGNYIIVVNCSRRGIRIKLLADGVQMAVTAQRGSQLRFLHFQKRFVLPIEILGAADVHLRRP